MLVDLARFLFDRLVLDRLMAGCYVTSLRLARGGQIVIRSGCYSIV